MLKEALVHNERGVGSLSMADVEMMTIKHTFSSKVDEMTMTSEELSIQKKEKLERVQILVRIIAGTSTILCLIVILTAENMLVVLSMLIGAISSPWVIIRQKKLTKLGSFRQSQNLLRHTINNLRLENLKLSDSADRIQKDVDILSEVKKDLEKTLEREGSSLGEFTDTLKLNNELLEQIKGKVHANIAQEIFQVVIGCDRSENFVLERNEREILIVRLGMINGVNFNEEEFRRHFIGNIGLHDLLRLLREIFDGGSENCRGRKIFQMEPIEVLKRDY